MSSTSVSFGALVAFGYYLGIKNLIRGIRDGIVKKRIVKHRFDMAEPLEGNDAYREGVYIVVFCVVYFAFMLLLTLAFFVAPD